MPESELLELLREMASSEGSQRALATRLGVSCQYLNDVLSGRRCIGKSLLDALGYEAVVDYREKKCSIK